MKRRIAAGLLALGMILVAAGCSSNTDAPGSSEPTGFTLVDMAGRSAEFETPATRIVVLTPSDCEILYAIGAGDSIVGRGMYCDYPEEVTNTPAVASGAETNIEEIIALEPQAVVMGVMSQTQEQVAALEAAGIPCVVSDAQDISGVYTAIEMLGLLTGREENGAALAASMQSEFARLGQLANHEAGTVYFEVSSLQWGDPWTAGSGTFMDELAAMLGLDNIFSDVEGWAQISQEQVIERNPDFIVTIEMYGGEGPVPEEEISSRAGWQDITAVRNGAVFNADNNEISRPGPRLVDAAQSLYNFVYGVEAEAA